MANKTFSFPIQVNADDRYLLEKVRAAGGRVTLDLDPSSGGLDISLGEAGLQWSFVSEIDSSMGEEFEDPSTALTELLQSADESDAGSEEADEDLGDQEQPLREYPETQGPERQFFTLDLQRGPNALEFFDTLAEAQAEVLRIAHRDGVNGEPEDVLRWMERNADVFWGRLMG
jgi:hypothetical protein